ncbi:hypothetical protein V496_07081 [Pseudogymnoascus sp. VKM F-4515 (FW-2607)]|nr:hypothetical protein V496_07081 [Pseudogymnoascus sp. VKM F-4515 (FW-2607)]KFY92563.1 hypothetical protein V498_04866 [Pseudogymnoascus sp. VKM F-4517 (FW-2822)]
MPQRPHRPPAQAETAALPPARERVGAPPAPRPRWRIRRALSRYLRVFERALGLCLAGVDAADDGEDEADHDEELDQAQVARADGYGSGAALDGFDGAVEEAEGGEEDGGEAYGVGYAVGDVEGGGGGGVDEGEVKGGGEEAKDAEDDEEDPARGAAEAVAPGEEGGKEEEGRVEDDKGNGDAVAEG